LGVNEADQQILTAAVMHEVGVSLAVLWVHYLSIGGVEMENAVAAYLKGFGVLPAEERDLLSHALNELVMDSPSSPQAPCSDAPLTLGPGP
jgi:hypothetical protein